MMVLLMVTIRLLGACLTLFMLGCSPATRPKQAEQQAEPVTGLHALAQMFSAARTWQPDVLVLRITNLNAGAAKPQPGRAQVWQGTFVSPTAGQARTYTFSVVDLSTSIRTGIFPDPPSPFSARAQSAQAFNIAAARKDTDEVYATAVKQADEFLKDHANEPANYLLELNDRAPDAMWRVYWGSSVATAPFSVLVDASSGEFFRTLK